MPADWQIKQREREQARRMRERREQLIMRVCQVAFILAIFTVAIGVRLLIIQGEWNCFWAEDVGLCMAVAGVGK